MEHCDIVQHSWSQCHFFIMALSPCDGANRCDSGYKGAQCEEPQDFNILYVVPSGQKLHYVLIAAIIGAVQIAVIVAVVMCIMR